MNNVRVDARMALARYESSVAAFGMEAGFPMKDVRVVQEYIEQLEAALRMIADGQRDADKSYAELFAEVRTEARKALDAK